MVGTSPADSLGAGELLAARGLVTAPLVEGVLALPGVTSR
jgi:hypothetical protein